jgi:threonyl-tRNA synthetase
MKSNFPSQATCSIILAAALSELFPDARIQEFQATETCFYCDAIFPFPFDKEMLPLLEDRMRGWIKKNIELRTFEMMPSNAAQFFEHHQNPIAAAAVRHEANTVEILQLDRFTGRSPGNPLKTTGEVKCFKLADTQIRGSLVRIIGTTAPSKEELKPLIDACKNMPCHLNLLDELQLLSPCPGGWLWLPRGERLKKILMETVQREFSGSLIATPALNDKDLTLCHSHYLKEAPEGSIEFVKLYLGGDGRELFNPTIGTVDRLFLPLAEKSIISFLQIITKFLKIFAFDYEVVIVGKSAKLLRETLKKLALEHTLERGERSGIEFRIKDALGRRWTGPSLWTDEKRGVVQLSLFHSLERFVALLIEKTKGELPFWLQPEQARILALNPEYAEEVRQALAGFRVGIDKSDEALAGRLRRSLHERVPFSIVVGDREKKAQELTVRVQENSASLTMSLETLISRLRQFESQ